VLLCCGVEAYCVAAAAAWGRVSDHAHAWEGVREPETGDAILSYAHGVPADEQAIDGLAGLASQDCELEVAMAWRNDGSQPGGMALVVLLLLFN